MSEPLWVERYRPTQIKDCILPKGIKSQFADIVRTGKMPNMILSGGPGTGKTTVAKALCNELGVDWIVINASEDNGIDTLRTKIKDFASTVSFSDAGKCVIMDECLSEDEYVRIGTVDDWEAVQLKDLQWGVKYPVVSFNMETEEFEDDIGELISEKDDELYEVELEDGRVVVLNAKHPFIIRYEDGVCVERTIEDGLMIGDEVVVM